MAVLTFISVPERTLRRVLILGLLYMIPSLGGFKAIIDPDIWWHLRTGQWIIHNWTTPVTDPFSSYGASKSWVAYSWLFDVFVYGLYQMFGLMGLLAFTLTLSLLIAAALHAMIGRLQSNFALTVSLTAIGLVTVTPLLNPRPWLVTILLFIIELDIIFHARRRGPSQRLWLLPLLFVLWANVHIQFIYGLFVLGLVCVESLIDPWPNRFPLKHAKNATPFAYWFVVTATCGAATLMTPYHFQLYAVIFGLIGQTGPFQYITELAPISFRSPTDWLILGITLAAVFSLGWHRQLQIFPLLLLGAGAFLSFRAHRDAWFVVVAAASIVAATWVASEESKDHFDLTKFRALVVACTTLISVIAIGWIRRTSENSLEEAVEKKYPVNAVSVVKTRGYPGPLYNHYNWGGYLIWRLPDLPVAIDGRQNIHGDERIERSIKTWSGQRDWVSDSELSAARLVIADVNHALASLLRLDPRFELVHEDNVAAVFVVRSQPEQ